MLLSSLNRLRMYCAGRNANPISNSLQNNRMLSQWLSAVSGNVEMWLNRTIMIQAYTEYNDMKFQMTEFFMRGRPIVSITDVYTQPSGIWDGSETPLTDCFIGKDQNSICFPIGMSWVAKNAVRFRYMGGMALHAVNSVFTIPSAPGTVFTVGQFVIGQTSGAVGWVRAYDPVKLLLTIENYYGIFQAGETVNQNTSEDGTGSVVTSTTLSIIVSQSLAESYPDLVTAVDTQIRYMWNYGSDFEKAQVSKDSVRIRDKRSESAYPFIEEAFNLLQPYRVMEI